MHAIDALRAGQDDISVFQAAFVGWGNSYSLQPQALREVYLQTLRQSRAVLDVGSGLSTIIMGIAAEKAGVPVYALEADPDWAAKVNAQLAAFNIKTVTVLSCPIVDGWYDFPEDDLHADLGLVLIDGPQHDLSDRIRAVTRLGARINTAVIMFDDIYHMGIGAPVHRWVIEKRRVTKRMANFLVSEVYAP